MKAGIKGGLASVISILLLKWVNPPGPAAIPLAAYLFTLSGRSFLRAGGTGDGDRHEERIRTQLAILPVEALQAATQIRFAGCSGQEKVRLAALVRALQALVVEATKLVSRRRILPEITESILRPQLQRLETEFKQVLDAFAECFRRGDCRRELPSVQGALAELDQAVEQIRQSRILSGQKLDAPVRVLELVNRYHATAEALETCGRLVQALEIQRYWGDYAL